METVLEILERAAERYGDRTALRLRLDDGTAIRWSYRELERRSHLAAWRLRALGLRPGDRLLCWAPSAPALAAVYFGAMRARLVLVPLDLRMAPDAIGRIVTRAEPRHLVLGTGRDAPNPDDAGLGEIQASTIDELTADPDAAFPPDWEAQRAGWERPWPDDVFDVIFTSGTTGTPKGVMLAHDNVLAAIAAMHRVIPPLRHRVVSLLPLSHLFEQAAGLFYALDVGSDILYVRSRNPRAILEAIRDHRTTSMIVVPQVLDLFWSTIEREVEKAGRKATFERLRRLARHLPYPVRRLLFRRIHTQLGGRFRLFVSSGAFLPPALQQAWEDLGITVIQGYGSTECGFGTCNTPRDHAPGTVGRPVPPSELRIAPDGEILLRGPALFKGYWHDPEATAAAFDEEGWLHTGDAGRLDSRGRLILMGRTRDMIVLPNGLNVFPEDVENALRVAGIRESVVLETRPGRIEAVVLAPDGPRLPGSGDIPAARPEGLSDDPQAVRAQIDAAVRAANVTLAVHQRVDGWRLWPAADFPRTHTFKVKRDQVRAWVAVEEAGRAEGEQGGGNGGGGGRPGNEDGGRRG